MVKLTSIMPMETAVTVAAIEATEKIKEDSLLGTIYKDLAQPAVKVLGNAIGISLEFCTTPMLLMKFGSEAAKFGYQKHLNKLAEKLKEIPEAEQIPVNPQIGAPILDKLTYTTNDIIAELFTNLLTKASSTATVNLAHPAFIAMIERLSVDEAIILNSLSFDEDIPCITFRAHFGDREGFTTMFPNQTMLQFRNSLAFADNVSIYLNNFVAMGIFTLPDGLHKTNDTVYEELKTSYNFEIYKQAFLEKGFKDYEVVKGFYQLTDFGKTFLKACTATPPLVTDTSVA